MLAALLINLKRLWVVLYSVRSHRASALTRSVSSFVSFIIFFNYLISLAPWNFDFDPQVVFLSLLNISFMVVPTLTSFNILLL
ncbi:hypothetical protein SLE2022_054390 [Rubroshorea leprosula]